MARDTRLEDIGWQALRQRQVSLEKFMRQAIRSAHEADSRVHLLDLALGSGRQIMEILRSLPDFHITATLSDAAESNLEAGRLNANQLGLTRVQFALGDAFDEAALSRLDPAPNVVLATGIYELTPDNNKVLASLRGLAEGMQPGGYLVHTDQPHNPHLEMIGRVAVQREESPWAMRRRPIEKMDSLLHETGFVPLENEVDDQGLFSVGLAQLPRP